MVMIASLPVSVVVPTSPAVFHNRIRRFEFSAPPLAESAAATSSAFAAMPALAGASAAGPNADLYRLAHQQARQQVAARRERARRSYEWN